MEACDANGLWSFIKSEMMRLKNISLLVALALILGLLLLLLSTNISSIRPAITIERSHYDSLMVLEKIAVGNGDFPIGALVIYKDSIIGTGMNTLRNMNEPMGHAEINALEDVFHSIHYSEFRALNRDSLALITSFEPCPMCKGMINFHDIRKVYCLNSKKNRYRLKHLRQDYSFYLKIRRIKAPETQ